MTSDPGYSCSRCSWEGDSVDRDDHYPVCPECGAIVDVLEDDPDDDQTGIQHWGFRTAREIADDEEGDG